MLQLRVPSHLLTALCAAIILVSFTSAVALADDKPTAYGKQSAHKAEPPPISTIKPVIAPRNNPAPIPHSSVHDPYTIQNFVQGDGLRPQSRDAAASAAQQGVAGKPGVLQIETAVSSGITLFPPEDTVCNNFNPQNQWEGETWTNYFAGWGAFAADDGYFQAKNVTFDREEVVGPGANYGRAQNALKIASNQPYDAGVMSPAIPVNPGDTVRVRVYYLIYNHDTQGRNWDYASMGIIPKLGERASYVQGYQRGVWAVLEQEIVAQGDQIVVMLQGHSPDAINSNIYFDNVSIWINGRALSNCRN